MSESLRNVLVSTSPLGVALAVAAVLTFSRPAPSGAPEARDRVAGAFLVGVAAQCLHFVEEFLTGLHARLPELYGLPPLSAGFFVAFNLAWIAIWILSALGLRAGVRVALVPIWFFAIGMVGNAVVHPALALRAGGYFPGLFTSPLVGVLGLLLWPRLLALTGGGATAAERAG